MPPSAASGSGASAAGPRASVATDAFGRPPFVSGQSLYPRPDVWTSTDSTGTRRVESRDAIEGKQGRGEEENETARRRRIAQTEGSGDILVICP